MNDRLESLYVEHLANFFVDAGFSVLTNVRLPPREIDILLLDYKTVKLIAVEVKREKWKEVIFQSLKNKIYVDYSYIAMPKKLCAKVPIEILQKYGVGMIEMNFSDEIFSANIVELPDLSLETNRFFKKELFNIFIESENIGEKL